MHGPRTGDEQPRAIGRASEGGEGLPGESWERGSGPITRVWVRGGEAHEAEQ